MASVPQSVRQQVISEAKECCEYCQTQQLLTGMPLVLDHIIPLSIGGISDRTNLAASCYRCNQFKGVKTSATDPITNQPVALFNPRQNSWSDHFVWIDEGTQITGLTAPGGEPTPHTPNPPNPPHPPNPK